MDQNISVDKAVENTEKQTFDFITHRYVVALALIALLATGSFTALNTVISKQSYSAPIINVSGRQRMLSQRTALFAYDLYENRQGDTKAIRERLQQAVDLMRKSHIGLTQGSLELKLPDQLSENGQRLYFEAPINLDAQIRAYLFHLNKILQTPDGGLENARDHLDYVLAKAEGILLTSLNDAVTLHENEASERVARLSKIEIIIYLTTLIVLLLEALFIFRPMAKQLARSQKELEEASRSKENFLSLMSHELRTPLNAIIGMSEILLGTKMTSWQKRQTQEVLKSSEHLLTMLDDILLFVQNKKNEPLVQKKPFDLELSVDTVLQTYRGLCEQKNLEIGYRYPPDLIGKLVIGDDARLQQIIHNLISNAVKFTKSGEILVRIDHEAEGIKISVEDTGIGLPKDQDTSNLYDLFTQSDSSSTSDYQGTGLGLSSVLQTLELVGGTINARNNEKGGATFSIFYPMDVIESDEGTNPEAAYSNLRGQRVAIVLTNEKLQIDLREKINKAGLVAVDFEDSLSLLKYLAQNNKSRLFDFIITDMDQKDPDSLEFIRRIRGFMLYAYIPIIGLTDNDSDSYKADEVEKLTLLKKDASLAFIVASLSQLKEEDFLSGPLNPSQNQTNNDILSDISILIVEDHPPNQDIMKAYMESLNIKALLADNGQEAVNIYKENDFDIILMDCRMPVMDGYTAARKIREYEQSTNKERTPIIAITANAVKGDREKCIHAGMDDYLSKPVKQFDLEEAIMNWLPQHEQRKALKDATEKRKWSEDEQSRAADTSIIPNEKATDERDDIVLNQETFTSLQKVLKDRLAKMLKIYIETTEQGIETMRTGFKREDAQAIANVAHPVKSSSLSFGAEKIHHLAKELEVRADAIHEGGQEKLSDLEPIFENFIAAYEELKPFLLDAIEEAENKET